MSTFSSAFSEARQRLGKGKTFSWNGKTYSTNFKEEETKLNNLKDFYKKYPTEHTFFKDYPQFKNGGKVNNKNMMYTIPKAGSGMQFSNTLPINVLGQGNIKPISFNPYGGGTSIANGPSHDNGGIKVDTTGRGIPSAEIEGGETLHQEPDGSQIVGGNLYIPGTKKKFKQGFKSIATQENKAMSLLNKGTQLLNSKNPEDVFQSLGYNAGQVIQWSADRQQQALAKEKQSLTQVQQAIKDVAEKLNVDPKDINKKMKFGGKLNTQEYTIIGIPEMKNGGSIPSFDSGGEVTNNPELLKALEKYPSRVKYTNLAKGIAIKNGIDPGVFHRLIYRESGFNPNIKPSYAGARGIAQFMPDTYKELGYNTSDLNKSDETSIKNQLEAAAKYFKQGLGNNNDQRLAAIRYNGGQGAINFVKKQTGNPNLTGQEWIDFMTQYRKDNPSNDKSALQNQTYNYVKSLDPQYINNADFYAGKKIEDIPTNQEFQEEYQDPVLIAKAKAEEAYKHPVFTPNDTPATITSFPQGYSHTQQRNNTMNMVEAPEGNHKIEKWDPKPTIIPKKMTSLADKNKVGIVSLLPELAALADKPGFVPHQSFQPTLFQPYQVSFQDRLNQNNASFRGTQQALQNNPEAQSILAAQKYNADNGIMADQFRTNQQIDNQITNQNIQLINQAREKNLALNDQQYTRQEQARANTQANQRTAINSIANKFAQNKLENNNIRLYENLFNYRMNPITGKMEYVGPNTDLNFSGNTSEQSQYQTNPNAKQTFEVDEDGTLKLSKVVLDNSKNKKKKWGGKIR